MFYYLDGTVAEMGENLAVIDISGAGYACRVTTNTLSRLETGKRAKLYTFCNIKEDAFDIYGFFDLGEKRCFEHLLGISGVGPKAALSILSTSTPESLALAVIGEDETALTVAPGVGKKLAQRIILEMRDKVNKQAPSPLPSQARGDTGAAVGGDSSSLKQRDARTALAVFGYSPGVISMAMRSIDTEALTAEEIIREVLRSSIK